jgi:hypothetical protein
MLLYSLFLLVLAGFTVEAQTYTIHFISNSSYAPAILKADTLRYKSRMVLDASLQVQAVQESSSRSYLQLVMTPQLLQVSDEGLLQDPDTALAVRLLGLPVYVEVNDSGRVGQVYFDTTVSPTYRQLWNQLIAYMQFITPGGKQQTTASWQVKEEDRVGFFVASYEMVAREQARGSRFRKQGSGYASFASQGLLDYAQQLDAEYLLDGERLSTVTLKELLEVKVKEDVRATTSSVFQLQKVADIVSLTSVETSALLRKVSAIKPASAAVTLSNFVTRRELKVGMYRQTLGLQTIQDVLSAIDTLTAEKVRVDDARLNRKVAALVYLYPQLLDSFMQRIATADPADPAFQVIIKGLAHAGTPAAQEKIGLLLYRHRNNPDAVDFFTNTLLFLEEPDAALIVSVQRIAYERQGFDAPVPRALRYLLGSFSYSLRRYNAVLGIATVSNTLSAINRESHKPAKDKALELLGIAGNAGTNVTFPMVRSYLGNGDEDIHAQALLALRLMDTAAVDSLLLQQFQSDTNGLSRMAVLTVLRYRPISLQVIDMVAVMLADTTDESLSISGARLLYENKKGFPAVIPLLSRLAGQTANAVLKKEINTLLSNQTN